MIVQSVTIDYEFGDHGIVDDGEIYADIGQGKVYGKASPVELVGEWLEILRSCSTDERKDYSQRVEVLVPTNSGYFDNPDSLPRVIAHIRMRFDAGADLVQTSVSGVLELRLKTENEMTKRLILGSLKNHYGFIIGS